jgi:dihydroorotate dehydrogenase electron transfer subunit
MTIHQATAEVVANPTVAPGYARMALRCPNAFAEAHPGQFIMLAGKGDRVPLLRRPFSIHRLGRTSNGALVLSLLYKVVGAATIAMSSLRPGDKVEVLGPLGQGFRLREADHRIFIAAGGIGVAPMVFLLDTLASSRSLSGIEVFLGGRSRDDLLCLDDFTKLGVKVHRTTDDGSDGDQCFLTHPLEDSVRRHPPHIIYACGPMGMLRCVAGIAGQLKVPCQVAIEALMACGLGACLGCAVAKAQGDGYWHVCKDGPVFDADQLDL